VPQINSASYGDESHIITFDVFLFLSKNLHYHLQLIFVAEAFFYQFRTFLDFTAAPGLHLRCIE